MLNFQASELARLLILIYLASYAVRHQEELRETLTGVLKPLALLAVAALLLLLEPDFGAASVLLVTGFAVLFIAGMPWKCVLVLVGTGGLALGAAAVSSAYRVQRLTTFLDPWADPFNSGFQLTQSLIAIGRGEWFGVGLGASVQKLFYLPEAHTDFVFAVMAEEFGLAGVVVVLSLFALLVVRVCRIAQRAAQAGEMFQAYLAAAFAIWVGLQAFINIGVNMGMLPTKGLTLPLMSYGRSSLLVTLAWLGIVLRVHHESASAGRLAVPRQDLEG
jgi:cell division protein FtsW